jgi:hypothetical protein
MHQRTGLRRSCGSHRRSGGHEARGRGCGGRARDRRGSAAVLGSQDDVALDDASTGAGAGSTFALQVSPAVSGGASGSGVTPSAVAWACASTLPRSTAVVVTKKVFVAVLVPP